MKIGYYVPPTLLAHSGISRRVSASVESWRRLGHEVEVLGAPSRGVRTPLVEHFLGDARVARDLRNRSDLDHVHARLFLPTPGWVALARTVPLTLEVHSGVFMAESRRDLVRVGLGSPTARALVGRARGAAFVTRQLSELREYQALPLREVIGNGIPLGEPFPAPENARPRVGMAVGTTAAWHGLDRYAELARRCPDLEFVVVCPEAIATAIDRMVDGSRVGVLTSRDAAQYEEHLASLDVAMGSMAMDRAGLTEGAPLKVRDYVSAGVPTALPYLDTNLSGVADPGLFDLRSSTPGAFREWVLSVRGHRVGPAARAAVDLDAIEARRVGLFIDSSHDWQ